jgi:hypothetical protein
MTFNRGKPCRDRLAKKLAQRFPALRRLKLYQPILRNHPAYILVVAVVTFHGGYRGAIFLVALLFPVQVEVEKPPYRREREGCQIPCIFTTYVADGFIGRLEPCGRICLRPRTTFKPTISRRSPLTRMVEES